MVAACKFMKSYLHWRTLSVQEKEVEQLRTGRKTELSVALEHNHPLRHSPEQVHTGRPFPEEADKRKIARLLLNSLGLQNWKKNKRITHAACLLPGVNGQILGPKKPFLILFSHLLLSSLPDTLTSTVLLKTSGPPTFLTERLPKGTCAHEAPVSGKKKKKNKHKRLGIMP